MSADLLYGTDNLHTTMISPGIAPASFIARWDTGQDDYLRKAAQARLY